MPWCPETSRCAACRGCSPGMQAWAGELPAPQTLPAGLVEEGRAIPVARVQAMHEGKRRKRAARPCSLA